jgi:multidrug efflux pump subunit AcrA (membrane-fusion protein)
MLGLVVANVAALITGSGWASNGLAAGSGELNCVIKPYMEVSLGAPVEGIIQLVNVDRGDWITKGQVLVMLEASVEEATVALNKAKADAEAVIKSTQAKVAFSSRKLERATDLYSNGAGPPPR